MRILILQYKKIKLFKNKFRIQRIYRIRRVVCRIRYFYYNIVNYNKYIRRKKESSTFYCRYIIIKL